MVAAFRVTITEKEQKKKKKVRKLSAMLERMSKGLKLQTGRGAREGSSPTLRRFQP